MFGLCAIPRHETFSILTDSEILYKQNYKSNFRKLIPKIVSFLKMTSCYFFFFFNPPKFEIKLIFFLVFTDTGQIASHIMTFFDSMNLMNILGGQLNLRSRNRTSDDQRKSEVFSIINTTKSKIFTKNRGK